MRNLSQHEMTAVAGGTATSPELTVALGECGQAYVMAGVFWDQLMTNFGSDLFGSEADAKKAKTIFCGAIGVGLFCLKAYKNPVLMDQVAGLSSQSALKA
jgi:hypothetical protein